MLTLLVTIGNLNFNFQECISPILDLLHRFSARFNIVVKDYPAGFHKELFNGGYDGPDYVSGEVLC